MSTQSKRIVRAYLLLFVLLAALSFLSLAVGSVRVRQQIFLRPWVERWD